MKSKGQFYIIAAVIIVVIVMSLVAVVNYITTKPAPVKLYDLSDQLEKESAKIINYGVATNQEDIGKIIDDFIKSDFLAYIEQKDPNIELIYIYGNETSAVVVNYGNSSLTVRPDISSEQIVPVSGGKQGFESTISIDIGGERTEKVLIEKSKYFLPFSTILTPGREVSINVSGKTYNFTLKGQQQFFAIITSEKEGEKYVSEI